METVEFGSHLQEIGDGAFRDCSSLALIKCNNPVPPVLDSSFSGVDKAKCKVIVPSGCIEAYKAAPGWDEFQWYEDTALGIDDVNEDRSIETVVNGRNLCLPGSFGAAVSVYGADGRCEWRMHDYDGSGIPLEPGIHIVRVGSATIKVAI